MREIDGATPDCETGKGCLIPPLRKRAEKVMKIYAQLKALEGLVDPRTILESQEANRDDLEYLTVIETEIRKNKPKEKEENKP